MKLFGPAKLSAKFWTAELWWTYQVRAREVRKTVFDTGSCRFAG